MKTKSFKIMVGKIFRFATLSLFLLFAIAPLYWIFITSLKPMNEIYSNPLIYFPSKISLESYERLFSFANFKLYFMNSLIVAVLSSLGSLIICTFSGFALSRSNNGKRKFGYIMFLYFTQMIPGFILMIPVFLMLSFLGLTDNLVALSLVYIALSLAFGTIMSKAFFDKIPKALEEAALIDGCNPITALFRIILPTSIPGLVAIFSFSFVNIWNELFLAVMLISSDKYLTIPVALNSFISKAGVSWDIMSAGIIIALLPTMIIFALGQKYLVAGLTQGSVKG